MQVARGHEAVNSITVLPLAAEQCQASLNCFEGYRNITGCIQSLNISDGPDATPYTPVDPYGVSESLQECGENLGFTRPHINCPVPSSYHLADFECLYGSFEDVTNRPSASSTVCCIQFDDPGGKSLRRVDRICREEYHKIQNPAVEDELQDCTSSLGPKSLRMQMSAFLGIISSTAKTATAHNILVLKICSALRVFS